MSLPNVIANKGFIQGPIQCCDSVESARSGPISELLKLLGIVLEDLDIDIGTSCSPISVLGLGGGSWQVLFFAKR